MARVSLEKRSFLPGDRISVIYTLEPPELPDFDVTNVSTSIFRVDVRRASWVMGFGTLPTRDGNTFTCEATLPGHLNPGLHFVAPPTQFMGGDSHSIQRAVRFEPLTFEIRSAIALAASDQQLEDRLQELQREHRLFSEATHRTPAVAAGDERRFRVLIFAVGTLIHANQQLEGYRIVQLQGGMSHQQMLNLANSYVGSLGYSPIAFAAEVEQAFVHGTPSIVVDYADVRAVDQGDAISFCRKHAEDVFLALGRDRGQVPKEFGFIAYDVASNQTHHWFHAPGYRGNLAPGFTPGAVAEAVERMLPRLQNDPFAKLISRTFVEALGEDLEAVRIFRLWTILELVADKHVVRNSTPLANPDGSGILRANGRPETNESQVGRVYSYIRSLGHGPTFATYQDGESILEGGDTSSPNYQAGMRFFTPWQLVRAAYAVRNYVAHEGYFDPVSAAAGDQHQQLAAQALTSGRPALASFVEQAAQQALMREA